MNPQIMKTYCIYKVVRFSYTSGNLFYTSCHTSLFFVCFMIYLGLGTGSHTRPSSGALIDAGAPCPGSWPFAEPFPCWCTLGPFPLLQWTYRSHLAQVCLDLSDLQTRHRVTASEGVCLSWWLWPSGLHLKPSGFTVVFSHFVTVTNLRLGTTVPHFPRGT